MDIERRRAMKAMAAGGVLATGFLGGSVNAQDAAEPKEGAAPWSPGAHEVAPLTFEPSKLAGLSEKLIRSHHENNYTGAVKKLNGVEKVLAEDNPPEGFTLGALKGKELAFTNSVVLHELYFQNLGGDGKLAGEIKKSVERDFGSTRRFEAEFRAVGAALGGGSGWAVLVFNFQFGHLRVHSSGGHPNAMCFGAPLLVLDMYEHAYHMDYGADAGGYIEAFFKNIDWGVVSTRLVNARKAAELL